MNGFFIVEPCNSSGGFEIKLRDRRLDLAKCDSALCSIGTVAGSTGIVILAKVDGFALSVYGSGRIMVKNAVRSKKKPRKPEMDALASKVMGALEKGGAII